MDIGPWAAATPTVPRLNLSTRASWLRLGGEPHLQAAPVVRKSPSVILARFDWFMHSLLEDVRITHRNLLLPVRRRETPPATPVAILPRASTARLAPLVLQHRSWIHNGFELAQPVTTQSLPCPGSIHLTDPQQLPPLFLRPLTSRIVARPLHLKVWWEALFFLKDKQTNDSSLTN